MAILCKSRTLYFFFILSLWRWHLRRSIANQQVWCRLNLVIVSCDNVYKKTVDEPESDNDNTSFTRAGNEPSRSLKFHNHREQRWPLLEPSPGWKRLNCPKGPSPLLWKLHESSFPALSSTPLVIRCSGSQACILVWPDGLQGSSRRDYMWVFYNYLQATDKTNIN